MIAPSTKAPRRRFWKYLLLFTTALLLVLAVLAWYGTTASFQALVRRRLIAELERVTGGQVELGSFHTIPLNLQVEVRDVTVHGREGPGEVPYAHVDRFVARIKIISLLGTEFGFHSILLDHPVVHFIVYSDGTTNQPQPKIPRAQKTPAEQLFSVSINRLDVQKGELLWDNQRVPFDFIANDFFAGMWYSTFRQRFESYLILGKVDTRFKDFRPFSSRVEAQFGLARDYIEISSLKWSSGRSHLEANGRVTDFRQPRVNGRYTGALDLVEVAAIARHHGMRQGMVELQGKGSWSLQQFASDGSIQTRNLDFHDENISFRNASLSSQFSVNDKELKLTGLQGRLLGGAVSGDVELLNWLHSPLPLHPKARPEQAGQQTGTVRLRMKDVSISALAESVSTAARLLDGMKLAGIANGTLEVRWHGSARDADTQISFDVAPPSHPRPGELPVSARARAIYRARIQELEVSEFTAATPASKISAIGLLSSTSSLRFTATTSNLNEWQPVVLALRGPAQLPITLHGHATFNGAATGKVSSLSVVGNLQLDNFESVVPATSRSPQKQVHWDCAVAFMQWSAHNISVRNGLLRRGETQIRFDVSAALQKGRFTDDSPFTAHLDLRNADLAEVESLAGYSYPASGRMNLIVQASGTRLNPHGDGHVQLTNATLYGEPVAVLSSDIRFINGEAQFNNLAATQDHARITGAAGYNFSASTFHFTLAGADFDLSRVSKLQTSRFNVAGRMDFTAQGSGTFQEPAVNAKIQLRDLTFDQERAGNFTIEAVSKGPDLHLTGSSNFQESELALDGNIRMRQDWPADLTMHFNHLDVDSLIRVYFGGRLTGHSAMAGDLRVTGPLRRPRELNLTANFSDFFVDIENIRLHNDGPIRFAVENQMLKLEQLHVLGDLTDFTAHGTAQLAGERRLDFHADGHVNLKLIESFNPDFTSSGTVTVGLNATGTTSDPLLQGRLLVSDGTITYSGLPSGLSALNGSILFDQDRLQIEKLTARPGGGIVNLGGSVSYFHRQATFDLTAQGQDVRLRYPPGVSSTANADLHLTGTSTAATLSGDITVTKLAVTPGFDFAAYLQGAKNSASVPNPNSLLNRIKLDVHVTTTPELQMQTALAKLTGDADLHMRGNAARPVLLGRVDIIEGEVNFNGGKYRLERGDVSFTNPVRIEPVLDLEASTRVSEYDITLGLNGPLDKLNVNYRSEPPLPSADIIALLALGRTREESAALQNSSPSPFSQEASNLILTQALNATVSNRVQRLFGVSRIKIDPQGLGNETSINRGPQVTIEQQVSNKLTLTYSTNVSQATQQIIQVVYNVTRNVSIVGLRDQNGVVSFDVKVRKRRK